MTDRHAIHRRVLRRETYSPRSGAAVILAALLVLVLLATLGLGVWAAADPAFRGDASTWITDVLTGANARTTLTIGGILCLIVAVALILTALLPGRRARHARMTDRLALVVDDGVLADAAADAVARECALDRSQVTTTIGRRVLTVRVTPTSGIHVDRDRVMKVAAAAVAGAGFDTVAAVDVAPHGVIA